MPARRLPASEIDCLRGVLPTETLRAAISRAVEVGTGADRVLVAQGVIDEIAYLEHLSAHTGIAIDSLASIGDGDCALDASQHAYAAQSGILPLRIDGELVYAIAPRADTAGTLARLVQDDPTVARRLRFTTAARLQDFLLYKSPALARRAVDHLHHIRPDLSARPRRHLVTRILIALLAITIGAALIWSILHVIGDALAVWFLACIALRIVAALTSRRQPKIARIQDHELPVYSVIVALYREAISVAPLLAAIEALDYPREKLDVILAVEPNDLQTRAAIARLKPGPHVRVIVAPAIGPQTKPKALNVALPFARGSFLAVYDAEDRPDPGQLRAALAAFQNGGDDLACAQASLAIDNTDDSRFARMFGADYAGQFDVVLPGLARLGLPLPLGGSSNHFRTEYLRGAGAWDAFNVTEDADLGMRLARFGLRSTTFASTTWEEAPIGYRAWRNQRARWFKGWMQTWLVHMAHPVRLKREAGWRGVLALNLLIGGSIVAALAFPVLPYLLARGVEDFVAGDGTWLISMLRPLHLASFLAALAAAIAIPLLGLARQRRLRDAGVLLWIVPYWACLSIAAWRALRLLIFDPTHWDKTEHGIGKSTAAPHRQFKDSASNPPPPVRAGASD